jgi:hypothetical protein
MTRNWTALAFALIVAVSTSSCGGGNAASTTAGNNNQAASLALNSSSLNFGNVAVGSSKTNTITLTNSSAAGGASVVVPQITISGAAFTKSNPALPLSLAASQSASLSVTFTPTAGGTAIGSLSVTVQGSDQPISVPLTGAGLTAGQLGVNPTTMNFGTVTVGNPQSQPGSLTAGGSDINVSSASWNGQGFSLSGITFPTTVKAGNSASFSVTFDPQAAGATSGQVSFVSDATDSPTSVTLSGTGAQPVQHSVSLAWNPSLSQIVGYYVYRSSTSGSYGPPLNSTPQSALSYNDLTVQSGQTYYYSITAVDSSSQQSAFSNEAVAIIP